MARSVSAIASISPNAHRANGWLQPRSHETRLARQRADPSLRESVPARQSATQGRQFWTAHIQNGHHTALHRKLCAYCAWRVGCHKDPHLFLPCLLKLLVMRHMFCGVSVFIRLSADVAPRRSTRATSRLSTSWALSSAITRSKARTGACVGSKMRCSRSSTKSHRRSPIAHQPSHTAFQRFSHAHQFQGFANMHIAPLRLRPTANQPDPPEQKCVQHAHRCIDQAQPRMSRQTATGTRGVTLTLQDTARANRAGWHRRQAANC